MLNFLRIRGLALLEDVALELAPGFNVLTGETGAGKSIIVGALSLLRGARGRADLVREGSDAALVDAQFDPEPRVRAHLDELLAEHGVATASAEDGILLHRTLTPNGRSRATVQSSLVTQSVLAQVGELLVDICSQHEHHFLTQTTRHLEVLDAWAKLEPAVAEHRERYVAWRDANRALDDLRQRTAEREQRIDYLRFQIDELDAAAPTPGEWDTLRRRVNLLRDARRWAEFARDAHTLLYEADDAISGRISGLLDRARNGGENSEQLSLIEEQLTVAQIACEEAARAAARFAGEIQVDPGELEQAEDRLHELERLRRKHGVDLDELAERLDQMRAELEELEHAEEHLAAQAQRAEILLGECRTSADELHQRRENAAAGLAAAIESELSALHIPKARLQVDVSAEDTLGPQGRDRVEFLFSANPGEPMAPLRKVASGGELSRVLLAIKGALSLEDRVATYVFDEVDAGVGGAVAEAIGRRLQRAASHHQVLCVTHLPQIAAFADVHFSVGKLERDGRTVTQVQRLDNAQRVDELARMLGGAKVSTSARDHAMAMLAAAQGARKPGRKAKRA